LLPLLLDDVNSDLDVESVMLLALEPLTLRKLLPDLDVEALLIGCFALLPLGFDMFGLTTLRLPLYLLFRFYLVFIIGRFFFSFVSLRL
jgi:hypothetical protein